MEYRIAEKFISINGEGRRAGQLAIFVRFAGCNLDCSYCDTAWANKSDTSFDLISSEDVYEYVKSNDIRNVTLTGGEPLIQEGIFKLLELLSKDEDLNIEIETNGSVPLDEFSKLENSPSFTMDYKLSSSNMEKKMFLGNLKKLKEKDTLKFVSGSEEDLHRAREIINKYDLARKTNVYISPVFGSMEPETIVEFMKKYKMNRVNLQLQLHKIIWDPKTTGV